MVTAHSIPKHFTEILEFPDVKIHSENTRGDEYSLIFFDFINKKREGLKLVEMRLVQKAAEDRHLGIILTQNNGMLSHVFWFSLKG